MRSKTAPVSTPSAMWALPVVIVTGCGSGLEVLEPTAPVELVAPCLAEGPTDRVQVVTCVESAAQADEAETPRLAGTVVDAMTGVAVGGAMVGVRGEVLTTLVADPAGRFAAALPAGKYQLLFELRGFAPLSVEVSLSPQQRVTKNVALMPTQSVVVSGWAEGTPAGPGERITLHAAVENLSATNITGYRWTTRPGPPLRLLTPDAPTTWLELPSGPEWPSSSCAPVEAANRTPVPQIALLVDVWVSTSDGSSYSGEVAVPVTLPPPHCSPEIPDHAR